MIRPSQEPKSVNPSIHCFTAFTNVLLLSDFGIGLTLGRTEGSLAVLESCLNKTDFSKTSVALMNLYLRLVQDHKEKITSYAQDVCQVTTKVVCTSSAKAVEKEAGIQIIRELIERKLLGNNQLPLKKLLNVMVSKLTDRFAQKLFQTIGTILKNHPEQVNLADALRFRQDMLSELEKVVCAGNKISFLVAAGTLDGLRYCFFNYAPDPQDEPNIVQRVYVVFRKFCHPDNDDRGTCRSALKLLKQHAALFGRHLLQDALEWHQSFVKWLKIVKSEDKEFLVPAVYAFYGQVAATMIEDEDEDRERKRELLEVFLSHFKDNLLDGNSKPFQLRLAILSFGILGVAVKRFLPGDVVGDLVNIVIANTNYSYFSELAEKRDKIQHLPDFIQALSLLIEHMDGMSSAQLVSLEKFIAALLQDFQYLAAYHHPLVVRSLINTFQSLSKLGGTVLEDMLSRVMLQGTLWACSHKLPMDTYQEDQMDWKQNVTYRNYLPLWCGLLANIENGTEEQKAVKVLVGDSFLKCLLTILRKLDLHTVKRKLIDTDGTESEAFFCDPDSDLVPQQASDFLIFFNLVNFYHDVLMSTSKEYRIHHLPNWFAVIAEEVILKSYEFPLVSGFMKLLELLLRIAYTSFESIQEVMTSDLKRNFVDYIKVVIARAKGTSGELQLTSLKLLFKAPDEIVVELIRDMADVFEIGFSIGKSVLWLAESALACLKRNLSKCSDWQKDVLLRKVLPLFDSFLLSQSALNADFGDKEELVVNRSSTNRRRRMIVVPSQLSEAEMDLRRVQKQIILFLGTLEPDQCLYMIQPQASQLHLTKWDIDRNVKLSIFAPDRGLQPELLLDNLMPRVFHLAKAAADRQTKLAACELVHGITLYVLGSRSMSSRRLWKEIYETLIVLACDSDTAVQQMFEPLMIQVMHFKARPEEWNNSKDSAGVLMEVIMNCLSDPKEPALRDMGAKALRELLSWTVELSSKKNEVVRTVVKEIVQIINFNSVDYNLDRRLGAALAFNNIYRILRENELVIDLYWLMLLSAFGTSLWLCDEQSNAAVAYGMEKLVEQVETCLDHVLRVIVEKPQIFKVPNEERLKPESFSEANLKGALEYVFQLTHSSNGRIRKKAQGMFLKICIREYPSVNDFLERKELRDICEEKLKQFQEVVLENSTETIEFLENLLVAIETHRFLIGDCKMAPEVRRNLLNKSVLFMELQRFLKFLIRDRTSTSISKKHQIMELCGRIIEELLRLLCTVSEDETEEVVSFLQANTSSLIQLCEWICFADQVDLPFDVKSLSQTLDQWLEKMRDSPWAHFFVSRLLGDLKQRMTYEVMRIQTNLETVLHRDSIPKNKTIAMNGIIHVQRLIGKCLGVSSDLQSFSKEIKEYGHQLATVLFNCCNVESLSVTSIRPAVKEYANHIMEFSLSGNYKSETIDMILNGIISPVPISQTSDKGPVTVGQLFLSIFRERVFQFFLGAEKDEVNLIDKFFGEMNGDNVEDILKIANELSEYVFKKSAQNVDTRKYVCEGLIGHWNEVLITLLASTENHVPLISDFVSHIGLIAPMELHLVGKELRGFPEWLLLELQKKDSSSDVKCKILSLLPIVTGSGADRNMTLLKALYVLKSHNIPHTSTELKENSLERAKYVVMMRTLLDSLRISKSLDVFEFLIAVTSPDEHHIMESELRRTITQLIRSSKWKLQLQFLNTSFQFFQKGSTPPLLKLNLFRRFIRTIIRACDKEAVKAFYETILSGQWEATVLAKLTLANFELIESGDEATLEAYREAIRDALVNRMVGFYLLELLYGSLELADMDKLATLVQFKRNTQSDKNRNMLTNLTKHCFSHSTEAQRFVFKHDPLNEMFRKYKCCASRALCTIIMSTSVEIALYNKAVFNKDIWGQIIGTSPDLFAADFVSDFEDFPRVKERIISMKADVTNVDADVDKFNTVFTSSLSQDVTKIDFTSRLMATETRAVNKAIKLEDLAMNNHDLMPTFCAVIQHMNEKKITTSTTPDWVQSLFKLMYNENGDVQVNIRLFIGRLVENCKDLLKVYAPTLFKGVLKLLVDKCSGSNLNVYSMDLLQMLIQWNVEYKPESAEEKRLMSEAVKYLLESCHNDNSDVVKLNLEIVRLVVVAWKEVLSVAVPLPYDLINPPANGSAFCGLQLIAIFLTNDLPLWTQATKHAYIEALVSHLHSDCNKTYKTAAQVIGYFLSLEEGSNAELVLDTLRTLQRKNPNKFVDILYAVHVKYPEIVAPFKEQIYNNIPSAIKTMRIKYLTMLLAEAHPLREIVAMGLLDMLKQREYQLYILHVMNKSLPEFASQECDSIVEDIIAVTKSDKEGSRLVAYEILCKILKRGNSSRQADITYTLIRGFRDPEESIQNLLLTFWTTEAEIPVELAGCFCKATEHFKGVSTMDDFLEFNAQLLLEILIKEENSTRQLLSTETEYDNKLAEYEINVSWRSQNLSKTIPLFARSLSSSFVPGQSTMSFKESTFDNQGNLMFAPTQDLSVIRPTETVLSIPTQSSFIFNSKGAQLLNQNSVALSQSQEEPLNPLKKRLIRDKDKAARNVAVQAMNKRGFEEQRKLYRRRDRNGKVVIYRRYRYGDFPDFLINYRALLLPLQALARRDQIVARKVFVGLFQSLVDAMEKPQRRLFCSEIGSSIQAALTDVKYCNANVYGTFMELSFNNPQTLPLEINVNISIHNNTPALAALILESKIAHHEGDEEGPSSAKRKPGGKADEAQANWMKVAELYKATKDSEIVSGIFAEKLNVDSKLADAIEFERNGQFTEAQVIYLDILNSDESHLEMDFCFEALFHCYLEMGKFSESVEQVKDQMGDWEQLWTDEWNRENLLPNMIHSQVKLLLDREEGEPTEFMATLGKWMLDKERSHVLKMDYPEELIVFNMIASNHLGARVLTEENIWSFANEWGHLSVLSENIRRQRLLDIRIIAELDEYLEILTKFAPEMGLDERFKIPLAEYPGRWASSYPQKSDSLLTWDFLFSTRRFAGSLLYSSSCAPVQNANFVMYNNIFKLAVAQRNTAFASRMLAKMKMISQRSELDVMHLKFDLAQSNIKILRAEIRRSTEGLQSAVEAVEELQGIDVGELKKDAVNYLPNLLEIVELMERATRVVVKRGTQPTIPKNWMNSVHKSITLKLQESIEVTSEMPDKFSSLRQTHAIRDIHLKLAQHCFDCLDRLPQEDMDELDVAAERERLQRIVVTSLLDSLRFESVEGQKLFPSILRFKKEAYLKQLFIEKCRQVPVAMFLKWIPQLLSHVNFEKESYLDDLLLRIAEEYPVAIYFPFQLSYEQFQFQRSGAVDRPLVTQIRAAIYDEKMEKLVKGLATVCLPQVMFSTHVTNLLRSLKIKHGEEFKMLFERTIEILWPTDDDAMRGRRFRDYGSLKKKFTDLLEKGE